MANYTPTHSVLSVLFGTEQLITAARLGTEDNRPAALQVAAMALGHLDGVIGPYILPEAVEGARWRLGNGAVRADTWERLAESLCSGRYDLMKDASFFAVREAEIVRKVASLDRNTYLLSTDKVEPLVGKAHDMVTVAQRSVSRTINHLSGTLLGPKVHKGVIAVATSEVIRARGKEEKAHINLKALQRLLEERGA